jgi:hypothetical protein
MSNRKQNAIKLRGLSLTLIKYLINDGACYFIYLATEPSEVFTTDLIFQMIKLRL